MGRRDYRPAQDPRRFGPVAASLLGSPNRRHTLWRVPYVKMSNIGSRVSGVISGWSLPSMTRDAEIDVYLVHSSSDPEDYFFLFDFETFVERSKGGIFVRFKLRVFAGRSDFGRLVFARQFR